MKLVIINSYKGFAVSLDFPINPFVPNALFLMFSGGRESMHWEQMG